MFFSKAILIVISIGAIPVLATPHALSHALHHRVIAARVAPNNNNNHTTLFKRQQSPRCKHHSTSSQIPPPSSATSVPPVTISRQVTPAVVTPVYSSSTQLQQPTPTTTTQPNPNEPSFVGDLTYFQTALGACGITTTDQDFIVAISEILYDSYPGYNGVNPNTNPVCGKQIQITYEGKSIMVKVVDRCTGCAKTDLDLTITAFAQLADPTVGRVHDARWVWV